MSSRLKNFLFAIGLVAGWLFVTPASATNCGSGTGTCFWIAGVGAANWSASTNWSDTDGGGTCSCTPATGDSVFFTANSGTNGSTINGNISLSKFDATGSSALTLTHSASVTVTITGDTLKFDGSITYSPTAATNAWTLNPGSGVTLTVTAGGKTFGNITTTGADATATITLADTFSQRSDATLTNTGPATLNFNNQNATLGRLTSSSTTARTLTLGSGTITLTTNSAPITLTANANLTLTATTGTIHWTNTNTGLGQILLDFGNKTVNNVQLTCNKANNGRIFYGNGSGNVNVTNGNLTFTNCSYITMEQTTVNGNWSITGGTSTSPIFLGSSGPQITPTITYNGGSQTWDWVVIQGLIKGGSGAITANNSYAISTVSGFTINNPASGGGGICIGC